MLIWYVWCTILNLNQRLHDVEPAFLRSTNTGLWAEMVSCPFKSGRINSVMRLEIKRKALTMFQNVNVNRPRGLFNPTALKQASSEAFPRPHRRSLCGGRRWRQTPAGRTSANSSRTAANWAPHRCSSRRRGVASNRHTCRHLRACSHFCLERSGGAEVTASARSWDWQVGELTANTKNSQDKRIVGWILRL